MNRLLLVCAAMFIVASTTGCGCLGILRPRTQTVAMPAVQCAPACQPCCPTYNNSCDSCGGYSGEIYSEPTIAQ
ncbi:hypothetical protein NG895_14445 [Aeoliella sp. ICT_H6.2]|uniref:Uncharacterized protein n=1 Tax=Aeoliella straminimaris TaxID=2954799 RepID=A0A9X2F9X2_9BACT|nr:hypothetical protein [Aeoliella straminimaris]MCO6045107.1 hypothetical protein [Aeoliella straminimaris]